MALSVLIVMPLLLIVSPQQSELETGQGGDWQITVVYCDGVGGASSIYWFTSIALDSNESPRIGYYDNGRDILMYAKWNGSAWSNETVDYTHATYLSLAIDSKDNPHMSYYDYNNRNLMYAKWNGSAWSNETIDSDGQVGATNSIAIDSYDNPHISYSSATNLSLKYAKWNGSAWYIETVDASRGNGTFSSLAIDSRDYPHISYYDYGSLALKYAKWNGSAWSNETVDSGNNSYVGRFPSLALDKYDYPHIGYMGHTNTTLGDVRYAEWNGSEWSVEVVDNTSHHMGYWMSMALDSDEHPHISYFDEFEDDLMYAEWNGSEWEIEIVDIDGNTGYFTSLAIDSYDIPHVSYYERDAGSVMYATKTKSGARQPEIVQADLGGYGSENVTITWRLSPDDGNGLNSVTGYDIYRNMTYDSAGLGYGLVASLPNGSSSFTDISAGEGDPSNYFYQLCAVDLNGNTSCAIQQAGKFTRPLSVGPNLISIPLVQSNESTERVLQTVEFDKAWTFVASENTWKWYMTFKAYQGELRTIDHKMGVWVNVVEDSNFTVAGIVPVSTAIQLLPGWNLIGYPSFDADYTVGEFKLETGVTRVEGYDPSSPPYYLKVMQDGDLLQAGYGYWVISANDVVWVVRNN
jgi:hypothetical protein